MITIGELTRGLSNPCSKKRYDSSQDAEDHIAWLIAWDRVSGDHALIGSYRCNACQRWHIGHDARNLQAGECHE